MMRLVLPIGLLLMVPAPVSAQLEVCNVNQQSVSVAVAVHSKNATTYGAAGWFALAPYQTYVLVPARLDLTTTDYFFSIVALPRGPEVSGTISICTPTTNFSYPNYTWGTACGGAFMKRAFNQVQDNGFWQRMPLGTALDVRQCRWTLSNPGTHRVEGYVYSEDSGPAPNLPVTIRRVAPPGGSAMVQSGLDGTFAFTNLQIAQYAVSVDSPTFSSEPVSVTIQAGQDSKGIAIKIVKK